MSLLGTGVMATWIEVAPEHRDNFYEWHTREHMPERLSIGGFRRGRRYIAIDADVSFFLFYETADIDVLFGAEYRKLLNNPTEWSQRTVRTFGKNIRGVCDVESSNGHVDGGFLAAIRLDESARSPGNTSENALVAALNPLLDLPKICGVHYLICDRALSDTSTALQSMRKIEIPDRIVLIEGCTAEAVRDAAARFLRNAALDSVAGVQCGIYQLECGLNSLAPLAVAN